MALNKYALKPAAIPEIPGTGFSMPPAGIVRFITFSCGTGHRRRFWSGRTLST
jgi:hypothetical protein